MECRKFLLTIISATDLENVRKIFKMKVYAKVSIQSCRSENEKLTPIDINGETNPAWNFTMRYTISQSMLENYNATLVVKLYCKRKLGDRYIGEVCTSMKELFDDSKKGGGGGGGGRGGSAFFEFLVKGGTEQSQGGLKLSCTFGETVVIDSFLLEGRSILAVF